MNDTREKYIYKTLISTKAQQYIHIIDIQSTPLQSKTRVSKRKLNITTRRTGVDPVGGGPSASCVFYLGKNSNYKKNRNKF